MSVSLHILVRVGPVPPALVDEAHRAVAVVLTRYGLEAELACRATMASEVVRCSDPKSPAVVTGLSRLLPRLETGLAKAALELGGDVKARVDVSDADDPREASPEQMKVMRRVARKVEAAKPPKAQPVARLVPYKFVGTFSRPAKELEALAVARGHAVLKGSTYDTEGVVVNGKGPRALDASTRAMLKRSGARIITEQAFLADFAAG